MSSQKVYLALQYLASYLLGIDAGLSQSAISVLMTLPNSRSAETEADRESIFSDTVRLAMPF
jgi:hypothetical protein